MGRLPPLRGHLGPSAESMVACRPGAVPAPGPARDGLGPLSGYPTARNTGPWPLLAPYPARAPLCPQLADLAGKRWSDHGFRWYPSSRRRLPSSSSVSPLTILSSSSCGTSPYRSRYQPALSARSRATLATWSLVPGRPRDHLGGEPRIGRENLVAIRHSLRSRTYRPVRSQLAVKGLHSGARHRPDGDPVRGGRGDALVLAPRRQVGHMCIEAGPSERRGWAPAGIRLDEV